MQTSYADEMVRVFKRLDGDGFDMLGLPDSSAFSHARSKLEATAFEELASLVLELAEQYFEECMERWKGYRILGLDGSTLQLPDTPEVRSAFDPKCGSEAIPHARISQCTDVLNGIVVDSAIASMQVGERELFRRHLDRIAGKDFLLTMDRGYAAHWLFQLCLVESIPFVARVKLDHSAEVAAFAASGAAEGEIVFEPTDVSREVLGDEGVEPVAFALRAARIELDSGETEILVTSIPEETMPLDDLSLCYELRWGSETQFRHQKSHLHMENFSGRTPRSVLQDYHANVFAMNLVAVLALPAHAVIREETAHREHTYYINMANAARAMRDEAVSLLGYLTDTVSALANIFIRFASDLSIWRCGRQFLHSKKNPGRKFHTSYKPIG